MSDARVYDLPDPAFARRVGIGNPSLAEESPSGAPNSQDGSSSEKATDHKSGSGFFWLLAPDW